MPFQDFEQSEDQGRKLELYTFAWGANTVRQTSGGVQVDLGGGEVYEPAAIERGDFVVSSDHSSQPRMKITVPEDHPVADLFSRLVPIEPITLRIIAKHADDPETEGLWMGFVRNAEWAMEQDRATLHCEPIPASFAIEGLRLTYERSCNLQLYGSRCSVVAASFTLTGSILTVSASGLTITSSAFSAQPSGWLTGGRATVNGEPRLITAHSGSQITILLPFTSAVAGDSISATAGCDRLRSTCKDKFNNLPNHGGYPWIPTKNPFAVGLDG
jgi:uncharacterized phage protein (TIGR02218 family)